MRYITARSFFLLHALSSSTALGNSTSACVEDKTCQCPSLIVDTGGGPEDDLNIKTGTKKVDGVRYYYLGHIYNKQADVGELLGAYERISDFDKNQTSWGEEFIQLGKRVEAYGDASLSDGDKMGAASAYLRASTYFRAPLHGNSMTPVSDEPFVSSEGWDWAGLTRKYVDLFEAYLEYARPEAKSVEFAFNDTTLPGYYFDASSTAGAGAKQYPVLIVFPGRDSKKEDLLFMCDEALRRKYHCLLFDGPGQGEALILQNLTFVPEWNEVVGAAIDFALSQPNVDSDRIGLFGNSMGGYLALKGAAGEQRLSAVISNPATQNFFNASVLGAITSLMCNKWQDHAGSAGWGTADKLPNYLKKMARDEPGNFDGIFRDIANKIPNRRQHLDYVAYIHGKPPLGRNGSVAELFFDEVAQFSMSDEEMVNISAAVLAAGSVEDYMSTANKVFDKLCPSMAPIEECPKERTVVCDDPPAGMKPVTLHCFDNKSWAYGHCQPGALGRATEVMFGWLDKTWRPAVLPSPSPTLSGVTLESAAGFGVAPTILAFALAFFVG